MLANTRLNILALINFSFMHSSSLTDTIEHTRRERTMFTVATQAPYPFIWGLSNLVGVQFSSSKGIENKGSIVDLAEFKVFGPNKKRSMYWISQMTCVFLGIFANCSPTLSCVKDVVDWSCQPKLIHIFPINIDRFWAKFESTWFLCRCP